jgi:hypothetical protein
MLEVCEMNRIRVVCGVVVFVMAATWGGPAASGQTPPPSALVNEGAEEALEAARAASPRDGEETFAYFSDDVDEALRRAVARVWDPERPREPSPRTSWGDPDLQGYWLGVSYTPLERPDELGDTALYTIEEAIEAFQERVLGDASVDPATVHYDWTEFGMDNWQSPVRPSRRTSLIVDPPDGKIPPLTPEGRERTQAQVRLNTLESRSLYERCITGNQGPPGIPGAQQTQEAQILQTPGYVVLHLQSNNDVRIIPLDGRPHSPDSVRAWKGEARGRWDGDTLVVETRNFHEDRKWRGAAGNLHLVERFTRIDDDTLLYRATVTDPTTWEAPWTIEFPWPKLEPPGLFEFACHEQNYGIINVMTGVLARTAEYEAEVQN